MRAKSLMLPVTFGVCLLLGWLAITAIRPLPASVSATLSAQAAATAIPAAGKQGASAKQAQGESAGTCALSTSFPQSIRQWCSDIQQAAAKEGVEPALIAAVMWQESGGDAQAYSSSGAVGLLQVMPRDGVAASFECASGPCFASRPSTAELLDPAFNISYGTAMLANLLKKYGSAREALKAYGPYDMGYSYADRVMQIFQNYK